MGGILHALQHLVRSEHGLSANVCIQHCVSICAMATAYVQCVQGCNSALAGLGSIYDKNAAFYWSGQLHIIRLVFLNEHGDRHQTIFTVPECR